MPKFGRYVQFILVLSPFSYTNLTQKQWKVKEKLHCSQGNRAKVSLSGCDVSNQLSPQTQVCHSSTPYKICDFLRSLRMTGLLNKERADPQTGIRSSGTPGEARTHYLTLRSRPGTMLASDARCRKVLDNAVFSSVSYPIWCCAVMHSPEGFSGVQFAAD